MRPRFYPLFIQPSLHLFCKSDPGLEPNLLFGAPLIGLVGRLSALVHHFWKICWKSSFQKIGYGADIRLHATNHRFQNMRAPLYYKMQMRLLHGFIGFLPKYLCKDRWSDAIPCRLCNLNALNRLFSISRPQRRLWMDRPPAKKESRSRRRFLSQCQLWRPPR